MVVAIVCTVCRDDLEVLDANSLQHFTLRPNSLPSSILLNSPHAFPTPVDVEIPLAVVFSRTTSLKIRFMQTSMWVTNVARVTVELRQYDDPRYMPALRVCSSCCSICCCCSTCRRQTTTI